MLAKAVALSIVVSSVLYGAPRLRISTAAIGPVNVAVGSNGPLQKVAIQNIGDGTLHLTASANVAWLAASVASDSLQISLQTAPLARGTYTGTVTLSDPNAIDTPQNITVSVQIGGGVPDRVDLLVAPGSSTDYQFRSGCAVTWSAASPAQGPSLSFAIEGNGSFNFLCHYTLTAIAPAGAADGDYAGTFTLTGSPFSADNRTVPAGIRVTSQPIAQVSPASLGFRIAQATPAQTQSLAISNRGLGTLNISGVSAQSTGGWLTATQAGKIVQVTADPGKLAAGIYTGTVTVNSNASNAALAVPVELDVLTPGPAVVPYGSIVDNAIFAAGDPLPPGGIVALFGDQLTAGTPQQSKVVPLDTKLGGATVNVNDIPAPLFYVSDNQIDFQIPYGTPAGDATIRVDRDGLRGNSTTIQIAPRSPRILTLPFGNYAVAVNAADQSLVIPLTPGINGHPAKAGDAITIYAIGLGPTSPAVASGNGAPLEEPLARVTEPLLVYFNRGIFTNYVSVEPLFAGLTPGFVGLYQVNVVVPATGPKGDSVPLYLLFQDAESNHVNIALQ